jgi:arabinan endo-1,5-alpha-L-arabinosidase
LASLAGLPAAQAVAAPAGRIADDPIAHDPTVIKQGRYYYSFITGDIATRTYLPMRRSTDLLHWSDLGPVFTTAPDWITQQLGTTPGDFWAPDISFFAGAYHLYYAASSFGTNNSVIALATTPTLDPASPDYHWTDHGLVLRSSPADNFNAIDPDLVIDGAGQPWLAFGSFWDGLKMRRLDRRSGLPAAGDQTLYSLASRGGASIEGASIVRRGGYYYLFASFDFCCRGIDSDYRVVVGRSTSVTGPYTDRAGVAMLAGGGTEVLRGYNEFRGPGGGDVVGDLYAHHYYDLFDNGLPKLSLRPIRWVAGWPVLGDPLSGSRAVGHGSAYLGLIDRTHGNVISNPSCGYEGADIRLDTASESPCAQWRPDERGGGYVSLGNRFSNKVAEVAGCVNADGARVAQWGWLDNDCQQFRFVPASAGWSTIQSKLAGRMLQAAGCGGAGAPIQTMTATGDACQQLRLQPVGDVLIADADGLLALDGCVVPVANRQSRPGACQRWRFEHVVDGYYRVVSVASGELLTVIGGRLVVARRGGTPAAQWRIEASAGGGYSLINRAGHPLAVQLDTP